MRHGTHVEIWPVFAAYLGSNGLRVNRWVTTYGDID